VSSPRDVDAASKGARGPKPSRSDPNEPGHGHDVALVVADGAVRGARAGAQDVRARSAERAADERAHDEEDPGLGVGQADDLPEGGPPATGTGTPSTSSRAPGVALTRATPSLGKVWSVPSAARRTMGWGVKLRIMGAPCGYAAKLSPEGDGV